MSNSLGSQGVKLFDLWLLKIDSSNNDDSNGGIDLTDGSGSLDAGKLDQIDDFIIQFVYQYDIPGMEGIPLPIWAHFEESDPFVYYSPGESIKKSWRIAHGTFAFWSVDTNKGALKHVSDVNSNDVNGTLLSDPRDKNFPDEYLINIDFFASEKSFGEVEVLANPYPRGIPSEDDIKKNERYKFKVEHLEQASTATQRVTVGYKKPGVSIGREIFNKELILANTDMHNMKIISRKEHGKRRYSLVLDGNEIWNIFHEPKTHIFKQFGISAKGIVFFDNVMVSNLANIMLLSNLYR